MNYRRKHMNQAELEIKNKLRDLKKDWNRYTRI